MKTVFDIGMYDGSDTEYYLDSGCRVIAVEANPDLVENAQKKFQSQIAAGELICVNAAITPNGDEAELILSGADLGSSSVISERMDRKRPIGVIRVPGITMEQLFDRYGVPDYLKVDIEGADRLCVLALTPTRRPRYLSFEIGPDIPELLAHIVRIGFTRFKIINQKSFREIANENCLYDQVARRLMQLAGFGRPRLIRRGNRFFLMGHSSGPVSWESDGRWTNAEQAAARLRAVDTRPAQMLWYDLHATAE